MRCCLKDGVELEGGREVVGGNGGGLLDTVPSVAGPIIWGEACPREQLCGLWGLCRHMYLNTRLICRKLPNSMC